MDRHLTMVCWKGDRFWLGKLLEHPEIMTQGETIEELEENLRDAYNMMVMEDVPEDHQGGCGPNEALHPQRCSFAELLRVRSPLYVYKG